MSLKKIHILDDEEEDDENITFETMEKGHFRNHCIRSNVLSEAEQELINYDDSNIVCCGLKRNLLIKRLLLPLFPGGISVLFLYNDIRRSFYLFPMIVFGCSFILFMNFPILVVHSNLKPTYFGQDLFIDTNKLPYLDLTLEEKKHLLKNLKWLLILLYSALSAALSDYWLFKTQNSSSFFEVLGVTGGILKIFQLVASVGGGFFLSKTRKTALKRSRKNSEEEKSLELIEINLKKKQENNYNDS